MATARARTGQSDEPRAVRFVLGGRVLTLADVDPTMTVLEWLRTKARRTGTKEGCAEGDCGACTVVVGEPDGDEIRYRAVNACILFVPALDGKELLTVEDLAGPDGALHPVQRAMVEAHGSQCGFCTPGIVMSLFALSHSVRAPTRAQIEDALAGNLCRCTGYRPIIEAAARACRRGPEDHIGARRAGTARLLRSLRRTRMLALEARGRRWFAPTSEAELARVLARHPGACVLAGGTDVGLWVTKQHRDLETVVHVGGVASLKEIKRADGYLEIGAGVTCSDALAAVGAHYPAFAELLRRFGSVQIRNTATLGGNVANGSPIGDSMPALIALGATVVLRRGATRRELPLDAFYLGYRRTDLAPGEYVSRLRVPLLPADRAFAAYKISKRFDQDISAVCGAYNLALEGSRVREIRICYGGMAATPKRAARCEAALRGREWSDASVAAAARALDRDFEPITDMRAGSAYRRLVARNLLYKFWLETAGGAAPPSLNGSLNLARYGRGAA